MCSFHIEFYTNSYSILLQQALERINMQVPKMENDVMTDIFHIQLNFLSKDTSSLRLNNLTLENYFIKSKGGECFFFISIQLCYARLLAQINILIQ
jgi:hypothetical protein